METETCFMLNDTGDLNPCEIGNEKAGKTNNIPITPRLIAIVYAIIVLLILKLVKVI